MGVIQKEATRSSIISWIGVFLGIFNVIFVVPNVLEAYGIYTFVMSIVIMLSPLIALGMHVGVIRFFSEYDDGTKSNRSILSFGIVLTLIGFLVFLISVFIFKEAIIDYYRQREPDRYQYLLIVLPLVLLTSLFSIITSYVANFQKTVVPNILKTLIKIILPLLLILVWFDIFSIWDFLIALTIYDLLLILYMMRYLKQIGEYDFRWSDKVINKSNWKEMRIYLFNGILLSVGGAITGLIDTFMVGSMIDIGETTAIYSIGAVISGLLIMPNSAVAGIAGPIVAKHWAASNIAEIQNIYNKAGLNLLIIGLLLFVGVWVSLDDVFSMMKNGDKIAAAKNVILFLGVARLTSMACGINGHVINLSPKYQVGTVAILFMAVLNIITNYFCITAYGMVGAALATAITVASYNLFLSGYLWFQYQLNPFSKKMLVVVFLSIALIYVGEMIDVGIPVLNIILRSVVIGGVYMSVVLYLNLSNDLTNYVNANLRRVLSWLK